MYEGSCVSTPVVSLFNAATILRGVFWYLMILICIALMTSDAEHLFMGLLSPCISPLEECLFMSFAHFLNTESSVFLLLSGEISLHNLEAFICLYCCS